ncbi:MAG TPA: LytTR family DNA-binding domain-containing protein [Thermoanaerobaculia bacterium]|nr:LytTR family DNA-binding domain-containing protein [Thermoanaerobaculia bacterium]
MLRVLIVDDERLARQKIRTFLDARDDVAVAGEAANVHEAIALVHSERPELLLLDIQMPGGDGFDVVRALPAGHTPAVVFITAHDDYALHAFEVAAVDYLLKPFDRRRFDQAIERAKKNAPRDLRAAFFPVKKRDRTIIVPVREVDWIEAEGKYVILHAGTQSHLVRDTIAAVAERLDGRHFVRIHRSTIVNLRRVSEIRDDTTVVLHDGTQLAMSRRFRSRVRHATGLDI